VAVTADMVIGLLHPGEMGAAVGGCLAGRGHRVRWLPAGRGPATAARAAAAGLAPAGTLDRLVADADVIVSVCPPHAALEVARIVASAGRFRGCYLDANAIAPGTARQVRAVAEAAGASYVDGGIIGPPPDGAPGRTRLYLSGARAAEIGELFTGTALQAHVIDGPPEGASAVKMAYAGWTKGSAALVLAVRALARAEGVEDVLLAEWALSQPDLAGRSAAAAAAAAAKGWRWTGEMAEIATAMAVDGLPDGFHRAAAEMFGPPVRPGPDEDAGRRPRATP
jgi:3-hydroxyisobutyrate dehydrogenase-like beta-hydroxyacid dehydrogenase